MTLEGDVTHIQITKEGLNELLEDYREEFYMPQATVEDVQSYLGLKVSISVGGFGDEVFCLLKSAEYENEF